MGDFFKGIRFKILVAILAVMAGFIIASIYTGGTASVVAQIIRGITEPVQRFSANVTSGVSDYFQKYVDAAKTFEENKLLREENNELRRQLADYERIRYEYEQQQQIADIRAQRKDLVFAIASVIERDYSNPFYSFTIDKGSLDDISLYDPVVAGGDGLVGYVVEVGLSTAKVMTILHVDMNIGASNSATRDVGSVTGTVDLSAEGLCRMEYLPRESETKAGDVIVTSGSGLFPKDLVVGTVVSVEASSGGNSLDAIIRPSADVQTIKDVSVITEFAGQGAE